MRLCNSLKLKLNQLGAFVYRGARQFPNEMVLLHQSRYSLEAIFVGEGLHVCL